MPHSANLPFPPGLLLFSVSIYCVLFCCTRAVSRVRQKWKPLALCATVFLTGTAHSAGATGFHGNHNGNNTVMPVAPQHYKAPKLRVGMAGSAPFVVHAADDSVAGIAFNVWQETAQRAGVEYATPYRYPSVKAGMEAIQNGQVDVLVGPITINARRAEAVAFSQPYFTSDTGIVGKRRTVSLWQRISPFFSHTFLYAVSVLLMVLLGLGSLLYLAERRHNRNFQQGAARGIGTGLWLSLQTMNTTGFGDCAPRSFAGRLLTGCWMILSLILSTSLVAGIASTLALSAGQDGSYRELSDLRGLRVATSGYHKLVNSIRANSAMPVTVRNVDEAMQLLREGKVQAVVYDLVQLQYAMNDSDHEQYTLNANSGFPQDYGFVFPQDSELRAQLDVHMLSLRERDIIRQMVDEWVIRSRIDGD